MKNTIRVLCAAIGGLLLSGAALAHPISLNSTITYSAAQPSGAAGSVAQWSGAAFDAENIGGSGVNADGGADNGTANDVSTRVSRETTQGQTFTTGSNANGYDVSGITVRVGGYTSNTATGANQTSWNLGPQNGPIVVAVGKVNGTAHSFQSIQNFMAGGEGNPGTGSSANGPGTYLTFNLPFAVHLDPNTIYSVDFSIGNGSNAFELLGTSSDPYAGGTAYTRNGATITPLSGDRVFQVNMTAAAAPYAPFTHPGALHTQADFDRMKAKIAAGAEPWKATYDQLVASPHAQTDWNAYDTDYIIRGGSEPNNYTRSQHDAQAIYHLALRWKLTGDVAYANHAVQIANVWSGLIGVGGDTNGALASGICGYLFATGGEILSTYPGWPEAEKQAYRDMMMRAFYTGNVWFLWNHFYTPDSKGGNTHYRLNWDTDAMASMAAIGILCNNRAVYQQAVDYFKNAPGNGRVERAAWYIHPDGTAQSEESGRDQPHNKGSWYAMALLCQMAWNQGDDLFGYDNNRVLRAYEYNAKYNNWNDVSWVYHRNASLGYTEGLAESGRYPGGYPSYELIYNHYANVKGIAAPWNKIGMNAIRPEGATGTGGHPSAVDHLGLGSLTYARDDISTGAAPSGLLAQWSKNQLILNWWGSATATSYEIQRATSESGPYTTLGTATEPNLNFTDTTVAQGGSYYYKVVAVTSTGNLESTPLLANQALVANYTFEGNTNDGTGTRHATAKGGVTVPGYAAGFGGGQAVSLNGTDQYVQLPVNSGLSRDVTLSTWVYWNGGNAWQRVFDFGSEIEKYMMLTVKDGSGKITFQMTTSRTTDGTITLFGPTMPTATWTHLAVTFNGETATLYVNGLPVAAGSSPRLAPMFSQPFCYLGRSMWNADPYFNGRIDNFGIYNYGLTGKEIYTLWGQGGANAAPVFSANPMTKSAATQDTAYTGSTLAGEATDANGGTLTYAKVTGPSWLTVASTGALSGTPANSDVGTNLFVVRVTDSSGATDDANLYITVANVNDAPTWTANPINKHDVTRDQPYASASLAGDATDLDAGATLTFSKVSGPAWLVVAADGTLSGTPAVGDVGANVFIVRVTDDVGAFVDATLNITVQPFRLRSQYTFEGSASDAVSSLNGTATGSPVYVAGRLGQALTFDGVDDAITLPADVANHRDITVAAFVYWNGGGNYQRVFDFGNNTDQYLFLTPNSGGGLRFAIKNGGDEQQINYASALPIGRWVHVAVTLNGDTCTLYVDGAAVATNTAITINPDDFRPTFNFLGDSQFGSDPLLNGRLDDFRIYNYALSTADIFDIANPIPEAPSGVIATGLLSKIALTWTPAQAAQTYTVKRSATSRGPYTILASGLTSASYTDTGLSNGVTYYYVVSATNAKGTSADSAETAGTPSDLLLHLKFNEATGTTTAADSSGNGYNATLLNSPAFGTGQFANAVTFVSTSSQHATLPTGFVGGVTDFTISAWVNPATFDTYARIFDFGTGTNNYMFLSCQYTGAPNAAKPRFAIRTPSVGEQGINSSITLTANTWNHVAVTLSGNTATMYVNGSVAGTNTGVTLRPSTLGGTTQNYLGKSQFGSDPHFNGAIDDFRIYSRALNASEVIAIAGTPATLSPPQALTATPGALQIALSWNTVWGATSYTVKRATTSGGPYTTIASGVTGTTYTDTGLTDGVTYYYIVSAVNNNGVSDPSSELSAKSGVVIADGFTELFSGSGDTNDTASTTFTFTPENNVNGYTVFRSAASAFPTDPTGGTSLTLADDASATVTLTGGKQALLYGVAYSTLYVGSNGFITFGSGDGATYSESTSAHFNKPRVSALFDDLDPTAGGSVSWRQLSDRVAVTWQSIHEYSATTSNNFQVEFFFDGKVRITLLSIAATDGLIGLSRGTGTPSGFVESNFSAYPSLPSAPTGLSASGGSGSVGLSWATVSGTAYYRVKRSANSGTGYVTVAATNNASYTDTAVFDGATYYYVVSAVNVAGESANSTEASATTYTTPQRWRLTYFGTTDNEENAADAADPDGDGWTNAQEFITGTDPTNAASTLKISQLQVSGNDFIVNFTTVLGKTYRIERSDTLAAGSWTTLQDTIAGTGGVLQVTDVGAAAQAKRFYRIVLIP